jgi:Tfp pilus assembly protein PilF
VCRRKPTGLRTSAWDQNAGLYVGDEEIDLALESFRRAAAQAPAQAPAR